MKWVLRGLILFWKSFFVAYAKVLAFLLAVASFIVVISVGTFAAEGETVPLELEDTQFSYQSGDIDSENEFIIVPIHGIILAESATDPLSSWLELQVTYGYDVKELLKELAEDPEVKGVLLHVDSPGGTVVGAKAIGDGVRHFTESTSKPVYAYVGGVAASGAYWGMAGVDKIIADMGTSIGSIGVIYGPFKYYDQVLEENYGAFSGGVVTDGGISTEYITAGFSKDVGSPHRKITDQERAILQEGVDESYSAFVEHVSTSRDIPEEQIRQEIGAMIYGELQAGRLGLIDAVGSRESAENDLAAAAGLAGGSYQFITPDKSSSFFDSLMAKLPFSPTKQSAATGCPLAVTMMAYHGDMQAFCH